MSGRHHKHGLTKYRDHPIVNRNVTYDTRWLDKTLDLITELSEPVKYKYYYLAHVILYANPNSTIRATNQAIKRTIKKLGVSECHYILKSELSDKIIDNDEQSKHHYHMYIIVNKHQHRPDRLINYLVSEVAKSVEIKNYNLVCDGTNESVYPEAREDEYLKHFNVWRHSTDGITIPLKQETLPVLFSWMSYISKTTTAHGHKPFTVVSIHNDTNQDKLKNIGLPTIPYKALKPFTLDPTCLVTKSLAQMVSKISFNPRLLEHTRAKLKQKPSNKP